MIALPHNEFWLACAFLPVLGATALYDLKQMRIPNSLSIIGVIFFAMAFPILGVEQWTLRALVGMCVFAVCFGLFAAGWFGGGDAKILPVTALFVPISLIEIYMLSFSFSMLLGMVMIWMARQLYSSPDATWVSMKPQAKFPMGISIAASLPVALLAGQIVTT